MSAARPPEGARSVAAGEGTPVSEETPSSPYRRIACVATSLLVGLSQGLGLQLVSANLSSIQGAIGATPTEATWMTTAYFATALSSSLLLIKARMQFGLQAFARCGITAFVVVAALHLVTDSLPTAIAVRAALGIAAAPLSTLAVLYMIEAMPRRLAGAGLVLGFGTLQLGQPLARVISTELLELGQWHGLFVLELALAVVSLGAIHAVALTSGPRIQAFSRGDWIAFPLYAAGFALLSVVISQGRLAWWTDSAWLGTCLACAVACLGLYAVVDLNRPRPLLDLRWLSSGYMLRYVLAVVLFRIVLSEQTSGVVGLMTVLGLSNDQLRGLFAWAAVGTGTGFFAALAIAKVDKGHGLALLATALVGLAALHDAQATSQTRPDDLVVTQTFIAAGLSAFFASACLLGFGPVVAEGGGRIVSFVAAFSAAQYLGSLLGLAGISTLVAHRQQWHFARLAEHASIGDPLVTQRIQQLGRAVSHVIVDPAARALQGAALFGQQLARESFVLAYNDVFLAIACLCLAMFAWLSLLAARAWRRARTPT